MTRNKRSGTPTGRAGLWLLASLLFIIGLLLPGRTSGAAIGASGVTAGQATALETPRIRLAVGEFDPLVTSEPAGLPDALRLSAYPGDGSGYYLVQFQSPIATSDAEALTAAGAEIFDYIPDFAFIVKMNNTARAAVEQLKQIRWVGLYQPSYRLATDLLAHVSNDIPISNLAEPGDGRQIVDYEALGDDNPMEIVVSVFRGEALEPIVAQVEHLGGVILGQSKTEWKGKLKVSISPSRLSDLVAISGVRWVEEAPEWKLANNEAADILGVREVWNTHGLYGDGQTVAVCDSGLDQGSASPGSLHDDFEDGSGGSRVVAIHDRVSDGANDVNSGHGTHVAGSVLGNGDLSGANPSTHNYPDTAYVGMAPEASLVFQAVEDNSAGTLSGIPLDLNVLFAQAAGSGANLHTNSWGSAVMGMYTSDSEDVDEYIWDHPEFTILFAAGNQGIDNNADGVIDLYSLDSPGTAKNCITVGATENDRSSGGYNPGGACSTWGGCWPADFSANPIRDDRLSDDPGGLAAFSSRGPTLDGRFKPDVVAPGTNIASVRSSAASGTGWGAINSYYMYMGGTSMSTPLVAGTAALVRDFYTDVGGIAPSAALVKATLINGATDISPGQYGTGSDQEIPDPPRPNDVEGWGRVNVEDTIFAAAPRELIYYDDTSGLNTAGESVYNFEVTDSSEPLRVTLAWSDYPGSPAAAGGLVNDLDLSVIAPGGTVYYPNNASQRGATQYLQYDSSPYYVDTPSSGEGVAVKFTPTSYPAQLDKSMFYVYATSYPTTFTCNVWDDDGTGGEPGSNLLSTSVTARGQGWLVVDISGVTITSGSFYVEMRFSGSNPWIIMDDDSRTPGVNWHFNGSSWSESSYIHDFVIRTVLVGSDHSTSFDRVNNVVGVDLDSPATGIYTVTVQGYNVPYGPQPYALVASGAIASATNSPPVIAGLPDQTLPENGSADNAIDLWAYAGDAESADNELAFSIANAPNPNAGVSIDSNRYVDINPTPGWSGQTDVTIRVTDPGGLSATDSFQVTVGSPDPDIGISPVSFEETVGQNQQVTRTLTLNNTGTAVLTFSIREQAGGFTPTLVAFSTLKNTSRVPPETAPVIVVPPVSLTPGWNDADLGPPSLAMSRDLPLMAPLAWASAADLPTARSRLAGATDRGCLLYAIGGRSSDGSYSDVNEVYDPQSDSWATLTPLPAANTNLAAAALNGVIYVPGGYDGGYLSTHQAYDIASDSWTSKAALPQGASGGVVAAANGKIYHIGGNTSGGYIATTYEYDPVSDSWTTRTPAPGTFAYAGGAVLDGYIYIAGGWLSSSTASTSFWRYDPTGDAWTVLASLGQGRQSPGVVAAGGYIYVFGGGVGWSALTSTEQYDPATNTWTPRPDSPLAIGRIGMATGWVRGMIWGAGGSPGSGADDANEYLDEGYPDNCGSDDVPWLSEDPTSGTVPAGGSLPVNVVFDAAGLALGDYTAELVIQNNDPDENPVTVPVAMHVVTSDQPAITSITPNSGFGGESVPITNLAGSNFQAGATVKLSRTGETDVNATNVVVVSDSQITCNFDLTGAAVGQWDVVVTNPDSRSGTLPNGFTIRPASAPPVLTSIAPDSGNNHEVVHITDLAGSDFQPGATVRLLKTGQTDVVATNVVVVSASKITCDFDLRGASAGQWTVRVTNPDTHYAELENGFTVKKSVFLPLVLKAAGPPEQAPVLNPIDNPTGDYDYTVTWSTADKATEYILEEDDNAGFSSPTTVYQGANTSRNIVGKDLGTYYYRVKALNDFGESDWSNVESTTVTTEKPPCPQAGSWSGTTNQGRSISFTVAHSPRCEVQDLVISYRYTCTSGSYFTVRTEFMSTQAITNDHFDTGGSAPRVKGDFSSTTTASGTWSYSGWDPYNPGFSCSGSGTWTTSYTP